MCLTLNFGAICVRLGDACRDPLLLPFVGSEAPDPIDVRIGEPWNGESRAENEWLGPDSLGGTGFALNRFSARGWIARLAPGDVTLATRAALACVVAFEAARCGLLVFHAGAVHTDCGVVALLGPSGIGKSTSARESGDRAFAYNGLLVQPRGGFCWPLPFTAHDDPAISVPSKGVLAAAVWLERAESYPSHEWLTVGGARMMLTRRLVMARGDPHAIPRTFDALRLGARIAAARLFRPAGLDTGSYLQGMLHEIGNTTA